ncbi:MAG: NAD(P)/FAD-dependent oxidoreductase [Candidatus Eisenbacteria bacterium]
MTQREVAVIGAGPAGLGAAIQLRRFGLSTLVLEARCVGGLLNNADRVENYPGFPEGIRGRELVHLFDAQARRIGVEVIDEEVTGLSYEGGVFRVATGRRAHRARAVVVASGTRPVLFPPGMIPAGLEQSVLYEVWPISDSEGKRVVVAGGGDAAFDYALGLARSNEVVLLSRGDAPRALSSLRVRVRDCASIWHLLRTEIISVSPGQRRALLIGCVHAGRPVIIETDYLVGALGRVPRLDFVSASLAQQTERLEAEGALHFAGDVKNGTFRQTAIAVGDGLRAAMRIHGRLKERSEETGAPGKS